MSERVCGAGFSRDRIAGGPWCRCLTAFSGASPSLVRSASANDGVISQGAARMQSEECILRRAIAEEVV